jgi:hypothetical protein
MVTCKINLLLLLTTLATTSAKDECNPSKKEPKGATKLKKLIEEQNAFKESIKASIKDEWENKKNKDNLFEKEVSSIFKKQSNSHCSESYYPKPVVYSDCKPINEETFANKKSLIAAFTNGRLGNQVENHQFNDKGIDLVSPFCTLDFTM